MPSDPDRFLIDSERLYSVFQQLPLTVSVTVLNAGLTAAVLAPVTNHAALLIWLGLHVTVAILRLVLRRDFLGERPNGPAVRWWTAVSVIGALVTGALWGFGLATMFPAAETTQLFLAFVVGGMCAGATTVNAAHFPTAAAFILPASLPLVIGLLEERSGSHIVSALMVV